MSKAAMKLALDAPEGCYGRTKRYGVNRARAIVSLSQALAEPEQPARVPLTQAMAEELAHRRCRRYIMIDTEAPYQFDGHTLMDFVADIEKVAMATIKESLIVESNQPRMPLTIDQIEVCMKRAYAAAAGSRNLEICFAREIESEHGIKPLCFGSYDPEDVDILPAVNGGDSYGATHEKPRA